MLTDASIFAPDAIDAALRLAAKSGDLTAPPNLGDADAALWLSTYREAFDETYDPLKAELAAWGAVNRHYKVKPYKSADGRVLVAGWGMLFTDVSARDVDQQFFDQATKTFIETSGTTLWYDHGRDPAYGLDPIGRRVETIVYPRGIWTVHELYPDHPQFARTVQEINDGLLTLSSDTLPQYARQGWDPVTGRLGVWPIAGWSLTKTPAEPGLGPVTIADFALAVKSAMQAEAREAQSRAAITATSHPIRTLSPTENSTMNPLLTALAAFFAIPADFAGVKSATEGLVGKMKTLDPKKSDGMTPEGAPVEGLPDMTQLRAALGLPADAENAAVVARLQEMLTMLTEAEAAVPAGMSAGKSFDFKALADATAFAAKSAPAQEDDLPYNVPTGKSTNGDSRNPATRHVATPIGRAEKPSLAGLVLGMLSGKSEFAMKSMGYSIGPNGGYLTGAEIASEMIELFRAQAIVMKLGATFIPMDGIETLTYRKQVGGATATYRGEGQQGNQSKPQFGTVQLQLKELVAGTRINRRLLRNTQAQVEQLVRKDLQTAIELRADLAALRGSGGIPNDTGASGAEPRGISNTTGVTTTALGANGAVPTIKNFVDAWGRIEDANVPSSQTWGAAMSPRTRRTLENLTDTTGQLLDVARWTQGHKVETTTQIPNNLSVGTSNDCSEVYVGDWQYLIVGMGQNIEVAVDESIYRLEGEIYIEATMMHDVGVSQPTAFQRLTGVRA